jgi:alkaline phosphatase
MNRSLAIMSMLVGSACVVASLGGCGTGERAVADGPIKPANVIFLHPDGSGANMWNAGRMLHAGPDGDLEWDKLPSIGVYRGHLNDALTASSNAGGTIHAYGLKAGHESFGNDNGKPLMRNGAPAKSIAAEALARGKAVGIVSSATVADAGTGTFLASTESRKNYTEIVRQMFEARPHVMLGGGEQFFLSKGTMGRHGPGIREDGRNLLTEARAAGYTVVLTREELAAVPAGTKRLLGVFSVNDTFLDKTEEEQRHDGTPDLAPTAPPYADMVRAALEVLSGYPDGFLLVAEEEGTDNFAGKNNARGALGAIKRADDGIGVARRYIAQQPATLLMVAADSDCGGMQVWGEPNLDPAKPLPERDENGAPMDGRDGTGTPPFVAAPDKTGRRLPFGVVWASEGDLSGAVLVRGAGYRAGEVITPSMDNTRIYAAIRAVLFGEGVR